MPLTHGIGIISPIRYRGTDLEANFRRGVVQEVDSGAAAWCDVEPPQDRLGYDPAALRDAVLRFDGLSSLGVIVTVGGLGLALIAQRYATRKPFLSLVGCTSSSFPGPNPGNFHGGVNLQTCNHDDQVRHLLGRPHNFQPGQICLLVNLDAAITATEMAEWQRATPARGKIFTARAAQVDADIGSAFTSFRNDASLRAMIVTADPLFQDHKEILIAAANACLGKRVCYPLQIYSNTHGHQKPSIPHTLHGPNLATAYFDLGSKAAHVIQTSTRSSLTPAQPEVHDR